MEHSLHLGAEHFVRGVAPTSSRKILKTVQRVVRNACDSVAYDLDQLNTELSAELADIDDGGEGGGDDEVADNEDSEVEYEVADSIGKALALVNQVSYISISVLEVFCVSYSYFERFASHRKLEHFSKSRVRRWMFRRFNFYIGSRLGGLRCSISLIESFIYNKYVSTVCPCISTDGLL